MRRLYDIRRAFELNTQNENVIQKNKKLGLFQFYVYSETLAPSLSGSVRY